jgi:hypothetical protein
MPDGDWQELPPDDAATRRLENSRDADGNMPHGSRTHSEAGPFNRPNGGQERTVTDTYHFLDYQIAGTTGIVFKCVRCGGRHDHYILEGSTLRPDLVYTPIHVAEGQWGQGDGWLGSRVHVTGTELRRIQTYRRPAGGGRETVMISWDERTIDHWEERDYVELSGFRIVVDCATGVGLQYGIRNDDWATDFLAAALDRTRGLSTEATYQLPAAIVASARKALANVERPHAYTQLRDGKLVLALVDRSGEEPRRVGTIHLEKSAVGIAATKYQKE